MVGRSVGQRSLTLAVGGRRARSGMWAGQRAGAGAGPGGSLGRQWGGRRGRLAGLGGAFGHFLQLGGGAAAGGGAAVGAGAGAGAGTVVGFGRTAGASGRPRRGASARARPRARARAGRALGPGAAPRPAGEIGSSLPTMHSEQVSLFLDIPLADTQRINLSNVVRQALDSFIKGDLTYCSGTRIYS